MSVQWNDKSHNNELLKRLSQNMIKAMMFSEGEVKKAISRGNVDGKNPSSPGEPPKVVTGTLRSSIDIEISRDNLGVSGFVGVRKGAAEDYGLFLELGTHKMAARPFLRPTIAKHKRKILRMIAGKR